MRRALGFGLCAGAALAFTLGACDNLAYDYGASGRDADAGPQPDGGQPDGGQPDGGPNTCPLGFASCSTANSCETNLGNDAQSCGTCGNKCYAAKCVQGACDVHTWTGAGVPTSGLAADGTYLYFGVNGGGTLRRYPIGLPTATSQIVDLANPGIFSTPLHPHGIVSDGARVVWSNPSQGPVYSVPVGGGATTTVANQVGVAFARALGTIFYTVPNLNSIYRVSATTPPQVTLVTTLPGLSDIAGDANGLYALSIGTDGFSGVYGMVATGATTYSTQYLGRYAGSATGLAVDASNLYWGNSTGTVVRMPRSPGAGAPVQIGILSMPIVSLTLDGTNVYFVGQPNASSAGTLYRIVSSSQVPEIVSASDARAVVTDPVAGVLWIGATNTLSRIPR